MSSPNTSIDLDQIQGNILAAFNKDHASFLLLELPSTPDARAWLEKARQEVASTRQVEAFNRLFKEVRLSYGREGAVQATWMHLAFSADGLRALGVAPEEIAQFPQAFVEGMRQRATLIGDVDRNAPQNWPVGMGTARMDALVIVASDSEPGRDRAVAHLARQAARHGVKVVFQQDGMTRRDAPGHEHFGFKDGISQPGVRGFTPPDPDKPDQGKPGQDLIEPGEFVIGYPRQGDPAPVPDPYGQTPVPAEPSPPWTRNGSFLVFRRLAQDVPGFNAFVDSVAQSSGRAPDLLAAELVGRYRSGVSLARSNNEPVDPGPHDASLLDDNVVNDFKYSPDPDGTKTPRPAHIRKVYPRDQDPPGEAEAEQRRILRRGIPFGHSFHHSAHPDSPYGAGDGAAFPHDRGLCFVCYQRSIEDQFEFLQTAWVNNASFPHQGDGQDPIISQSETGRSMQIPGIDPLTAIPQWVTTTGGEYFLSPSLAALEQLAAGTTSGAREP